MTSCQATDESPEYNTNDDLFSTMLRGLHICLSALQEGIHIMAVVTAYCAAT